MTHELVIYGAGGFGREVLWAAHNAGGGAKVVGFVDDTLGGAVHDLPVLGLPEAKERFPEAQMVVAVGPPAIREQLVRKAEAAGYRFAHVRAESALCSDTVRLGGGSVICAGSVLTVDIEIGAHAQINLNCTIGHDVRAGDYLTLAPGVHLSGNVHLGDRVYVGTGAVILPGSPADPLYIANDTTIGAGCVVTKSVREPGRTVVGVPGKVLGQ